MISIYDKAGEVYPLAGYEDFCITHKLDGCDTMSFILNMKNEQYPLLQEEGHVDTDDNRWLIKKIDDDKIDCELDFDFLKGRLYFAYKSETKLLSEVLARHLPSDWTVLGASQSAIRRSISFDACTDFDVIYECIDTYKVRFMWNMKKKTLTVVVPENVASSGEYLTTELNLRSLSFKGDTTEFATRLYCVGKDGMTIEEARVDDGAGGTKRYGLPYVEDRSYADKVICAYWEDDRYTDPTSMYNDGMEKLKVLANPVRSYECDVVDLAKMSPEYSFLEFIMHRRLTLVDVDRGIKVEHRIVEYDEWPDESYRNKVTLSCVPGTIQGSLKSSIKSMTEQTERRTLSAVAEASERLSKLISESSGLYPTEQKQPDGSSVWLLHDKRTLEESTIVIKIGSAGIGLSTDGGDSYPYGYTVTGKMVMDYIAANGIDCSWLNAGVINLALLSLAGTLCGLMQGCGSTKDGRTTQGIVMFGAGKDDAGNAKPPYLIVTDAGVRHQISDTQYVYYAGGFASFEGMSITASGSISAGGDLAAGGKTAARYTSGTDLMQYATNAMRAWLSGRQVYVGEDGSTSETWLRGNSIQATRTIQTSSDERVKKDIRPLPEQYLRVLDNLNPVLYRYRREDDDAPPHIGYVAQNLQDALSSAGMSRADMAALGVYQTDDGDERMAIAYDELLALMHLKMKYFEAEINDLKEEKTR